MGRRVGCVLAVTIAVAGTAAAELAPVRLDYRREAAAARCPDEVSLRAGVTARLGADPFRDDATRGLEVTIARNGDGLGATIILVQGGRRARRALASPRRDCSDLKAAVELAVSLAIDPLWEPKVEVDPVSEPDPEIEILEHRPAERPRLEDYILIDEGPIVEKPEPAPGPWHLGVSGFATVLANPDLIVSLRVELGLRTGRLTIAVEPWLTLPASTAAPGGYVTMSFAAVSLMACGEASSLLICGEVAGGAFQAIAEGPGFVRRSRSWTPFGGFGARLSRSWTLYRGIGISGTLDLIIPVARTTLYADSSNGKLEAWSTPSLMPSLGLAFFGKFP